MSGITVVGFFLVSVFFGIIITSLWLRLALRFFRVSYLNQLSQLIHTLTNPLIYPVQLLLRQKQQAKQRYDWLTLVILVLVEFIKIALLSLIAFHAIIPFSFLIIYVVADLIIQPLTVMFYAILIRVIMSFTHPGWQHPINDFLRLLTDPLLVLGRKIIPDISGFDFSPYITMIIIKTITLFITASLPWRLL